MKIGMDVYEAIKHGRYQLPDADVEIWYKLESPFPDWRLEAIFSLRACSADEELTQRDLDDMSAILNILRKFTEELRLADITVDKGLPPVPALTLRQIQEATREEDCCKILEVLEDVDYTDAHLWESARLDAQDDMNALRWKLMTQCKKLTDLAEASETLSSISDLVKKMEALDEEITRISEVINKIHTHSK